MIVIPMAGLSQRFRNAGYTQPKYMLDLHGRTVFARSVLSFEDLFETSPFLFVARDEADTPAFIEREMRALGVRRFQTVVLPQPTRGQADTVAQGLERAGVGGDVPLTVFNIDTFRPGFRHPDAAWARTADGYLEVMEADDPGFSYVEPDPAFDDDRVLRTAEKQVISRWGSNGLYHFARAGDFLDVFQAEARRPDGPEIYVAPLYNALIGRGSKIHYAVVDPSAVIFCGTPGQYEDLLARPAGELDR